MVSFIAFRPAPDVWYVYTCTYAPAVRTTSAADDSTTAAAVLPTGTDTPAWRVAPPETPTNASRCPEAADANVTLNDTR